jgi:hypothetical protein
MPILTEVELLGDRHTNLAILSVEGRIHDEGRHRLRQPQYCLIDGKQPDLSLTR